MTDKQVYKILFRNQDKIYEIHAHDVRQSTIFGFIEVEGLIFGEKSNLLVDPSEEKLQAEFTDVELSHIPAHAIVRIDKVAKKGVNKITPYNGGDNVTPFPAPSLIPQNRTD